MANHKPLRTNCALAGSQKSSVPASETADARQLSPDELRRWAELVANAEVAFPEGLSSEDCARLVAEVQRRRRARLVQYVARVLAQDILRSRGQ